MVFDKFTQARIKRLAKMGWFLISFGVACTFTVYFLPDSESNYWLSQDGKEGFYVLSLLFIFLGFYCFGAIRRERRYF